MTTLRQLFSTRQTPQNKPLIGQNQVRNSAGGYAWQVDHWAQLDRFLILGSEGGTYYIKPQPLTIENAQAVIQCLDEDGLRVIEHVVEVSENGRSPRNDPALFVLAMAAGLGDDATRKAALNALPRVARIGTHLFLFLDYVEGFRGWGRGLRRAVGNWYNNLTPKRLAYQAIKYQQRHGWSHRDALRLSHPQTDVAVRTSIYGWITQGWPALPEEVPADQGLRLIWAFEQAKQAKDLQTIQHLVTEYGLPWETLPTEWLAQPEVWKTLLPQLPMTALLRNLARMTANGTLTPKSKMVQQVVQRLTDREALRRARIHPIAVLAALKTYAQGRGARGNLTWNPITEIIDALDTTFHKTFQNVEPTRKRIVLSLDVSGSMSWGQVANVPGLTPRVASAAMALVTAVTEPDTIITAFSQEMVRVNISSRQRLDDVLKATDGMPFSGTDCSLPMLWALENKVEADAFIIYTDSETWAGKMHPVQALQQYRRQTGIAAKLIVVGMVSNGFTIADPQDAGMLDVVGFDTATPAVIANFLQE